MATEVDEDDSDEEVESPYRDESQVTRLAAKYGRDKAHKVGKAI
jgi:hypothetical protein